MSGVRATAQPLVLESDEGMVVVLGTTNGDVYAFLNAQPIEGFPLSVGATVAGTPYGAARRLTVASGSGRVHDYVWESVTGAVWGQRYATSSNTSVVHEAGPGASVDQGLFVDSETYNWPTLYDEVSRFFAA